MPNGARVERIDPTNRLDDEQERIEDEVAKHFEDPEEWMRRNHPLLGGRSPDDCVQTGDEQMVWELLRSVKYVGQT